MQSISPAEALELCLRRTHALIDVRSEGEFAQGSLPGFFNRSILTDDERHRVGLTYKEKGQDEAVRLGHELVGPHRESRVREWAAKIAAAPERVGVVACWRGGLRSRTAAEWIREAGASCVTVEGGYKAMRRELLATFEAPPPLLVLSGPTGSGKTRVLSRLSDDVPRVDLERLAAHRGSAFGKLHGEPQPSQATFDNRLGLNLWAHPNGLELVVEDESLTIGRVALPKLLKERMGAAPVVLLDVPLAARVSHISAEYVDEPLARGVPRDALLASLEGSIQQIHKKLGGELCQRVIAALRASVLEGADPTGWIAPLLTEYYDKAYQHSFERQSRQIIFQGGHDACIEFLNRRFA